MEALRTFCSLSPHDGPWMVRLVAKVKHGAPRNWTTRPWVLDTAHIAEAWPDIDEHARQKSAHVFIRPERHLLGEEEHRMILVDLDHVTDPRRPLAQSTLPLARVPQRSPPHYADLHGMAEQMKKDGAWAVVRTSEYNLQAWFWAPWVSSTVESTALARLLCQRYGADPGSANACQLGRAPGTANAKPDAFFFQARLVVWTTTKGWHVKQDSVSQWLQDFLALPARGLTTPALEGKPATQTQEMMTMTPPMTATRPARACAEKCTGPTTAKTPTAESTAPVQPPATHSTRVDIATPADRSSHDWKVAMQACEIALASGAEDIESLKEIAAYALGEQGSQKCKERPLYARETAMKTALLVLRRAGRQDSHHVTQDDLCSKSSATMREWMKGALSALHEQAQSNAGDRELLAEAIASKSKDPLLACSKNAFPPWGEDLRSWAENLLVERGSERCQRDPAYTSKLASQASALWCAGFHAGELIGDWRLATCIARAQVEPDQSRQVEPDVVQRAVDAALSEYGSPLMHAGLEKSPRECHRDSLSRQVVLTTTKVDVKDPAQLAAARKRQRHSMPEPAPRAPSPKPATDMAAITVVEETIPRPSQAPQDKSATPEPDTQPYDEEGKAVDVTPSL